jgi:hypothetical protein
VVVEVVDAELVGPLGVGLDEASLSVAAAREQSIGELARITVPTRDQLKVVCGADVGVAGLVDGIPQNLEVPPRDRGATNRLTQPEEFSMPREPWPSHGRLHPVSR